MTDSPMIFNRPLYHQRRKRFAEQFPDHDVIHQQAQIRVMERLDTIDRVFDNSLIIGAPDNTLRHHPRLTHCYFMDSCDARLPDASLRICADEEWLPIADASLDVVISICNWHHINDLPGVLIQSRRALKPDGLLLVVLPGARTLSELRHVLTQAEMLRGGVSPRISPFVEVRDAGGLLQRTGFALPVVDSEMLTLSHEHIFALMKDIRGAAEGNILMDKRDIPTSREMFLEAARLYQEQYSDDEGRVITTVELLCMTAWVPHASQQQPAKRGSGRINLNDALS